MKKPESLPVEKARQKFADLLDGTQHHSQHWQITRRGKPAGYVVPPEWWERAIEALDDSPGPEHDWHHATPDAGLTCRQCGLAHKFWSGDSCPTPPATEED